MSITVHLPPHFLRRINLHSRRTIGPVTQHPHKFPRSRDGKVHLYSCHIRPFLDKHDPQRVLRIDMAIVRNAAGLGTQAGGMLDAPSFNATLKCSGRMMALPVMMIMVPS